jgi:hypothetical protein
MKELIGLVLVILLISFASIAVVRCETNAQKQQVSDSTSVCCQDSLCINEQKIVN